MSLEKLTNETSVFIRQQHELAEWLGFESRNKYQISDSQGHPLAFAAEQSKGFLGWLMRQFLGHWRSFEVHFFNTDRQEILIARHPFRFFFQRMEFSTPDGKFIGAVQKRFSILTKRFDVENEKGLVIMEVASPLFKLWTFTFKSHGKDLAHVRKKWSGVVSEFFTDRDNFLVEFVDPTLTLHEKTKIMAAAIYIDLIYFENKAGS